jgi:transaldolase
MSIVTRLDLALFFGRASGADRTAASLRADVFWRIMMKTRPGTKLLLDGGDPGETRRIRDLLGFLDGQTTNPSLVAKNPEIKRRIDSLGKLSAEEEKAEYRRIVRAISPLVGDAGVSIEVFSDLDTTADQMLREGKEMFSWIENAYVKYPCTREGLQAAQMSIREGIRVNVTLCFSQHQAAAVYAVTKGSRAPVYVSPFVGRLDDIGINGVDLVTNIKRMYERGDHHVHVLAASLRGIDHLLSSFSLKAELATAPGKVLEEWAAKGWPLPGEKYEGSATTEGKPLKPIPYEDLDLDAPWESFNLNHDLTTKGIKKFVADYEGLLSQAS